MIAIALQSGSNGNCIYVESAETRLLFDAGISGIAAERRLAKYGRDIRKVDAVIISHDHADHVRCAGVYHRKYRLPVYISRRTFDAAIARCGCFEASEAVHHFEPGCALRFGAVTVETVPTPHDAAEGVAFVVAAGGKRLGILTDSGTRLRRARGTRRLARRGLRREQLRPGDARFRPVSGVPQGAHPRAARAHLEHRGGGAAPRSA